MLISHANMLIGNLTGNAFHAGAIRRDLLLAMGFSAYIPKPPQAGATQRWACPAVNVFHNFPAVITLENGTVLTVTKDDFLVGESLHNFWAVQNSVFKMSYEFVPTQRPQGEQIKLYEQGWRPCNKVAPSWSKMLTTNRTVQSLEGESSGAAGDFISVGVQNEMWIAKAIRMNDYVQLAAGETEHPRYCGMGQDQTKIPYELYAIGIVLPYVSISKVYDLAEIEIFSSVDKYTHPMLDDRSIKRSINITMDWHSAMQVFKQSTNYFYPVGGWSVEA